MLEHTKKPLTDAGSVFLGVVCQQATLKEVKAVLEAKGCTIREEKPALPPVEERNWLTPEEVFPHFHAGDKIIGLRYRENMTQKQLAEKAGISVQNLSHIEHGRRSIGKEMAKRLAKVLNTDWRLLLE
ncbi:MAG: helix-turn-helix domain-containing protein [Desulfobulbus sp.]|nr:helix-turn-helix domain-containing protein [Desulfobulbus sp.]